MAVGCSSLSGHNGVVGMPVLLRDGHYRSAVVSIVRDRCGQCDGPISVRNWPRWSWAPEIQIEGNVIRRLGGLAGQILIVTCVWLAVGKEACSQMLYLSLMRFWCVSPKRCQLMLWCHKARLYSWLLLQPEYYQALWFHSNFWLFWIDNCSPILMGLREPMCMEVE